MHHLQVHVRASRRFALVCALLLLAGLASTVSAQTTHLVPSQFPTIQGAIVAAVTGDTVKVSAGVYNENIDFLGKGLLVQSATGAAATTIRGNFMTRVVTLGSSVPQSAILDGFTIENGAGGILLDSNSATVRNCVVRNNATTGNWGGGGLLIVCKPGFNSSPLIQDCEFVGNYSTQAGGGLFVDLYNGSTPAATCFVQIDRCRFIGNQAAGTSASTCSVGATPPCPFSGGGGVAVRKQDVAGTLFVTFNDCELGYNGSYRGGGGAYSKDASSFIMNRSRIHHNASGGGSGGGLSTSGGSVNLGDCVIAKNVANGYAGGLHASSSQSVLTVFTIKGCTIVDNVGTEGGGIYISTTATGTLSNSIVWGNSGGDLRNLSSIAPAYCNFGPGPTGAGPSNSTADPLFLDRANGDYHLARVSPLVDAGDPFATGLSDIDGGPRIAGARIDIGADEVPVATLNGSGEDLEMHVFHTRGGDPHQNSLGLIPGDLLYVRLKSAGGGLIGSNPLIVGQPFTTGFPPLSPPTLPGVHLDGFMLQIVYGATSNGFLVGPGLGAEGILLAYVVPPGLSGNSFRMQGFAVSSLTSNGHYAVTEAHDLVF